MTIFAISGIYTHSGVSFDGGIDSVYHIATACRSVMLLLWPHFLMQLLLFQGSFTVVYRRIQGLKHYSKHILFILSNYFN